MKKSKGNKEEIDVNDIENEAFVEQESSEVPENPGAPEIVEEPDWQDKFLRLFAEFDNYKKRTAREREQTYQNAAAEIIEGFLPILDSFKRASETVPESEEAKKVHEGLMAVARQTEEYFESLGVTRISTVGMEFDPNLHNAVMHVEDDAHPANMVIEEFAAGYRWGDRVIRHSVVKVAN